MLLPRFAFAVSVIAFLPPAAFAGMPSITLSDVARISRGPIPIGS